MVIRKHFSSEREDSSPLQPHPHLYTPQVCEYSWHLTPYSRAMLQRVFWLVLSFTIILPAIPQNAYALQHMPLCAHLHIHAPFLKGVLRSARQRVADLLPCAHYNLLLVQPELSGRVCVCQRQVCL